MNYYNNFLTGSSESIPQELAKVTMRGTKDILKMVPTIFQLLLGYLIIDYFIYVWDYSDYFSNWRNNVNAEKLRRSLDAWFGDDYTNIGRTIVVFLIYATATYISTIKYGKSLWTLSGPLAVLTLVLIIQLILRYTNKYNGDNDNGTRCTDQSLGCESWYWISYWTDYLNGVYGYTLYIVLGIFAGFIVGR